MEEIKNQEQNLDRNNEKLNLSNVKRSFSIEDLRKAFEDAKKGEIEKVPVVIDQYGSINIEEHYVANLYKTFEEWYCKNYR
jgi:glutaredoxin-related protein